MMLSIGKSFLIYDKVDDWEYIYEKIEEIDAKLLQRIAVEIFAPERQSVLIYK